jgi:phosphoribosylformimino-5-aminoimidazole carboxamide ribonucleotide (ProFAR) isomerase
MENCARIFAVGAKYAVMGTAAIKTPEVVKTYPRVVFQAAHRRAMKENATRRGASQWKR